MKNMKPDRRSRYTKRILKETMIELLQSNPITKITVTELCDKADINRSTFYAHYVDIYDLLKQIEEETFLQAKSFFPNVDDNLDDLNKELLKLLINLLQYYYDNHEVIEVLMSKKHNFDFQSRISELSLQNEKYNKETETNLYRIYIVAGCSGVIQNWVLSGMKQSVEQVAETIFNVSNTLRKHKYI